MRRLQHQTIPEDWGRPEEDDIYCPKEDDHLKVMEDDYKESRMTVVLEEGESMRGIQDSPKVMCPYPQPGGLEEASLPDADHPIFGMVTTTTPGVPKVDSPVDRIVTTLVSNTNQAGSPGVRADIMDMGRGPTVSYDGLVLSNENEEVACFGDLSPVTTERVVTILGRDEDVERTPGLLGTQGDLPGGHEQHDGEAEEEPSSMRSVYQELREDDSKVTITTVVGCMGLGKDRSLESHLDGPGKEVDVLCPHAQLTADTSLSDEGLNSTDSPLGARPMHGPHTARAGVTRTSHNPPSTTTRV